MSTTFRTASLSAVVTLVVVFAGYAAVSHLPTKAASINVSGPAISAPANVDRQTILDRRFAHNIHRR
jgi:hypothetical protein